MSNYFRCVCGFQYCIPNGEPAYCRGVCLLIHETKHNRWEQAMSAGYPPLESRTAKSKWCLSCEQRYNVTNHVCREEEKSKDWIDIIADLP
jgi:hypothetical protein